MYYSPEQFDNYFLVITVFFPGKNPIHERFSKFICIKIMWRLFKTQIPGSHPNSLCVCGGGQKFINCRGAQTNTMQLPNDLSLTTLPLTLEPERPSEAIHPDPSFYEWDTGRLVLAMQSWSMSVLETKPGISVPQYSDALLQITGDDGSAGSSNLLVKFWMYSDNCTSQILYNECFQWLLKLQRACNRYDVSHR